MIEENNDNEKQVEDLEQAEFEKLEKLKKVRSEVLNRAVSGNILNTRDRVAFILNNYNSTRNSDKELAWKYWQTFEGLNEVITETQFKRLTKLTSLSRWRAKIQNEYKLFQATEEVQKFRGVLKETEKQTAFILLDIYGKRAFISSQRDFQF